MKRIPLQVNAKQVFLVCVGLAMVSVLFFTIGTAQASNYSQITSQLDFGDRNQNVTNLQVFLSANPSLYPEGKVTGYYGPLTQSAVRRFQSQYGIDPVGRVGPLTMAKINNIILGGGWNGVADISGPQFYSVNQSIGSNTVTLSWTTNENATAKVFYSPDWITMNEGGINSVGFGAINGSVAVNDGVLRTSQQVTISGLQPNTLYHYVIVSTDQYGNVSVWNPNTTFRTTY